MGSSRTDVASHCSSLHVSLALLLLFSAATLAECQTFPPGLNGSFYFNSCPNFPSIVTEMVNASIRQEPRMAASLLRLHFHDCWPNGCDASVLLNSTSTFESEKFAPQNNNSLRGFEVIDAIKAELENVCPHTVSCADILTKAAEVAVFLAGGPGWPIAFGRRDSTTSAYKAAAEFLPTPDMNLDELIENFASRGFNETEMITLSGSHTFGRARCLEIENRLYPKPEADINSTFLAQLKANCPKGGNVSVLNNFDHRTPDIFDNLYYENLQQGQGLLHSDQQLFSARGSANVFTVNLFASDNNAFFTDFFFAIIKMDNLSPLTGKQGEVRLNCHKVNSPAVSETDSTDIIEPLLAFE